MYQYILFDLDGTLTNSELGITTCVQHALKRFGIEVEDRTKLRPFIGPPLGESFQVYYGLSQEESEQAIIYYRERFSVIGWQENEVYEGIPELLDELKGKGLSLIVATSKPEVYTCRILEHFGLARYFDFVAGSTLDGQRDAKAEVIAHIQQNYPEITRENTVMVGDRKFDVAGAHERDLPVIGVLYGYGDRAEMEQAGADFIAEDLAELKRLLLMLAEK